MENIRIDPTDRSPLVDFDFETGRLRMEGESYPEDSAAFFGPLLTAVRAWLTEHPAQPATVDVAMSYFNSSSAKALMNLFKVLEEAAAQGRPVIVNWHYVTDDDTMEEFGEDFALDFNAATFRMCPADPAP
ncbi:DUF1987 domain-containing protein [Roseospira goensis]|uniref:SiaC family regulatory phosphoprotein domain-containing protein n=1 Tax=Roseospira goensis TaxID=391922 RepID=A0A7W6WKY2_9PROT|nr:DUF1987 domain-containing protein [Roseospira goensis]MBB4286138.1 hypothetical protein [Roseospira goensis]